jgi:hypothetical protein
VGFAALIRRVVMAGLVPAIHVSLSLIDGK